MAAMSNADWLHEIWMLLGFDYVSRKKTRSSSSAEVQTRQGRSLVRQRLLQKRCCRKSVAGRVLGGFRRISGFILIGTIFIKSLDNGSHALKNLDLESYATLTRLG